MPRLLLILALAAVCTTVPLAGAQTGESEPNDVIRQAAGPLAGGVDVAAQLTGSADHDWFFFYTARATDLDVAVTNTSSPGPCGFLQVALLDTNAEAIISFGMEAGDERRITEAATGHQRFYLRVDDAEGCKAGDAASYTLRAGPAEAITSEAPPGLRVPPCQDARDRLAAAQKALRRARGAKRKRAARRKVAAARRAIAKSC